MKIKGAVFDLDGTLLDTERIQWQGWVDALKQLGISLPKDVSSKYAGKAGYIIESELIRDYNLNLSPGPLLENRKRLSSSLLESQNIDFMPYALESVKFFGNRGTKMAIASGSIKKDILLKLSKTGMQSMFDAIVSIDDVKRGKPNPDIYLKAVRKLGLNPRSCLSFEDTQYGLQSAKLAGLICLAVPSEFSQGQDFSMADGVFKNLKEAIDWAKEKFVI